jgi:hypothetical protein
VTFIAKMHDGAASSADRWLLAIIFCAGALFYGTLQIHHDVAWYVYCNFRQLEGMQLYVDFIEINPPISFYLTMPPVLASVATGLPVKICLVIFVIALTAGSLFLAMAIDQAAPEERRWKMIAGAAVLMVVPICVFGQREHFAVLLSLPYFYACAARLRGQGVTLWMAITAGLMAGIGLSIKHYFLLAPLLVEAYLIYGQGSVRSLFRPEIYAATIAGLLHAAFALIFHPEYFTVIVPLILAAYDAYGRPLWFIALMPWNMAVLVAMAFWLMARRYITNVTNADILFVAALAFVLCVIWQNKGWAYHTLPTSLLLALASIELVAPAVSGRAITRKLSQRQKWTIPAAPIILIVLQTLMSGPYRNDLALVSAEVIARYAPGGSVFVMSSNLSVGFPMVLETKTTWASRFATQWLLPQIVRAEKEAQSLTDQRREQVKQLAKYDVDVTVADFEKFKPDIVFVDQFYEKEATWLYNGISVDLIQYYLRDVRFARLWSQYRKVDTISATIGDDERTLEVWVK